MSTMVIFIAGMLTGWILEWLFFTFVVKKRDDVLDTASVALQTNESVSGDKNEANGVATPSSKSKQEIKLEAKDVEKPETTSVVSEDAKSVDSAKQADQTSKITETTTSTTSTTSKIAVKEKIKEKEKEAKGAKDADSKVSSNKVSDNKATSKKQPTQSKSAKPATKNSNVAPKKKETKKATAAKKGTATKKVKKDKNTKADDLTALKGIGPKLAKSLSAIGINRFSELAKLKGSDIVKQLEGAGHKVINKPALDTLAPQAKLAAKGDADGLAALQKSL